MKLPRDAARNIWFTLAGDAQDDLIFIGDCFFHTVEALVAVEEAEDIDRLPLFVLRAFEFARPADVEHLDAVLHLGRQVTRQILSELIADGLLSEFPPTYCLTEQGRRTAQTGQLLRRIRRRRVFHFLYPGLPYVAIHDPKGNLLRDLAPGLTPAPWEFDPATLRKLIAQPAEWKRRQGFPQEITEVITSPAPPDQPEGATPASDAIGTARAPLTPQHLIVDKAQVVRCAIVVRTDGSEGVNVTGYAISGHGSLIRGKEQPIFMLHESGAVRRALSALLSLATSEQVSESWMALAALNELPDPEQAVVKFEDGRLVVLLNRELLDRWRVFVALAVQDNIRWYVPHGQLHRICCVAVEGADASATMQLEALRAVLRFEQEFNRADTMQRSATCHNLVDARELPSCPSLRELANLVFRFGRYRLAYEIGELEDMNDATV